MERFLVLLNKNFIFSHEMTVIGAILLKNKSEPEFHEMKLIRIENGEYVLNNCNHSENHQPEGKLSL